MNSRSLAAAFPILQSPAQPATKQMRFRLNEGWAAPLGAHEATTENGPVWLVAASSGRICLFAGRPPASVCEPVSLALTRGLTLGVVEAPSDPSRRHFILYGVTPSKKRSIRVRIGAHQVRSIPVRNGVFSLRARRPVSEL
jgi:hypothetical protein